MNTVVVTEGERERRFTNEVNKAFRHCRIGKVVDKHVAVRFTLPGAPLKLISPWPHLGAPLQTSMPKCGCKVGSACGNVACPHRLIATCNTSMPPIVPTHGTMM